MQGIAPDAENMSHTDRRTCYTGLNDGLYAPACLLVEAIVRDVHQGSDYILLVMYDVCHEGQHLPR